MPTPQPGATPGGGQDGGKDGKGGGKGGQKGKGSGAAAGSPPPYTGQKKECKFFLTKSGCSKGGQCTFFHKKLQATDGRCHMPPRTSFK